MGIRESLLNTITSVGSSDFVRIVTSAGASSKATLQNVIKSFETGLGAKTSLTTSDYIRVVGSDNNLYKQSVDNFSNVIKELNDTILNGNGIADKDLNNFTTTNIYHYDALTSAMTNAPNTGTYFAGFLFVDRYASNKVIQRFYNSGSEKSVYIRFLWNGTWSAWTKQPTRAEIDALNSKTVINTSTNFTSATTLSYTGVSYTIPANTFYAIMFNAVFINNGPQEILLSKSNSSTNPYLVLAHSNGGAMASIAGTTDESITVYVWARYGGVGQNRMDIDGIVKSLL